MRRREFLRLLTASSAPLITGCALTRVDLMHVFLRSERIWTPEQEQEVLAKARLGWTDDGRIRVLYAKGTPYERGYQHGALLRDEVQDNLGYLYEKAVDKFHSAEFFAEAYERLRPHIPDEYIEEMHGLAHGSRLPLEVVHHVHALPSISEWGGRKRLRKVIKKMVAGTLGTSCSNFSMTPQATADGKFYSVRILDWGLHRISKLHEYPLIAVNVPDHGVPSANVGWVGFLGAVSGMNAQGITLGEMGYGDPEGETLRGKPMVFLLRDVLSYASNLGDVRKLLKESPGTSSFGFVMTDGKTSESEIYIKDATRFRVFQEGHELKDRDEYLPGIPGIVYGGHFDEKMAELLKMNRGAISLDMLRMQLIPEFAMKSNFQNVIYAPKQLELWVNNAKDTKSIAAQQPYTHFDLAAALR